MGHGRSPGFWLGETSGTNAASFRVSHSGSSERPTSKTRKKARAFTRGDLLAVSSTKLSKDSRETTIAEAKGMWLDGAGWRDGPCGRLLGRAGCAATERDYGGKTGESQATFARAAHRIL